MAKQKRAKMKITENSGQYHKDVDRLHTYSNRDWVVIFTKSQGYYDNQLGAYVKVNIEVKSMPTRTEVLRDGLIAFATTGKEAHLVMRNNAL